MSEGYLGLVVEPRDMQKEFSEYAFEALHYVTLTENKAIVTDQPDKYFRAGFDMVGYEELPDYVDQVDPEKVFLTSRTDELPEVVEMLEGQEVVLDRNVLARDSIKIPTRKQVLQEELKALIPMYKPEKQGVQVSTSEEVLQELGLQEFEAVPVQVLMDR